MCTVQRCLTRNRTVSHPWSLPTERLSFCRAQLQESVGATAFTTFRASGALCLMRIDEKCTSHFATRNQRNPNLELTLCRSVKGKPKCRSAAPAVTHPLACHTAGGHPAPSSDAPQLPSQHASVQSSCMGPSWLWFLALIPVGQPWHVPQPLLRSRKGMQRRGSVMWSELQQVLVLCKKLLPGE